MKPSPLTSKSLWFANKVFFCLTKLNFASLGWNTDTIEEYRSNKKVNWCGCSDIRWFIYSTHFLLYEHWSIHWEAIWDCCLHINPMPIYLFRWVTHCHIFLSTSSALKFVCLLHALNELRALTWVALIMFQHFSWRNIKHTFEKITRETPEVRSNKRKPRMLLGHRTS